MTEQFLFDMLVDFETPNLGQEPVVLPDPEETRDTWIDALSPFHEEN